MSHVNPRISIVIVNYNCIKYLANCLCSVSKTNYPSFEVILVDNNSTDGSLEVARNFQNLILIENERNEGFAEGCNIGIAAAKGELITLLNPDTLVEESWLNDVVGVMQEDPSVGIVQSKLMLMDRDDILDDTGIFLDQNGFFVHPGLLKKDEGQYNELFAIFSAKGAAMTIRTNLLKEVGTLDSDFFAYLEESDLCWRAWLRNYKVVFVPTSTVYHAWGASSPTKKSVQFMLYLGTRNRIMMLVKNLQSKNILSFLVRNISINIIMSLYFLMTGKSIECVMIWKGILWNLRHCRMILRKRAEVQKIRRVPDKHFFATILKKQSLLEFYRYHNNFVKPRLSERKRYT